ncbi:hypothetical protein NX059_007784 [Plenodomus lindquistii]|nr:hypothetical protein NX059_007784 [Plenodomus lindquistii]
MFNLTFLLPRKSRFIDKGTEIVFANPSQNSRATHCPICCGRFTPHVERLRITKCGHVVCTTCLAVWLDSFNTCPTCNKRVYRGPPAQHSFIGELEWHEEVDDPEETAERAFEIKMRLPDKSTFYGSGLQHYKEHMFTDVRRASLDNAVCSICLESLFPDIYGQVRVIKACAHLFHNICLGAWLGGYNTCPVCRARLFTRERQRTMVEELAYNPYYLPHLGDTRERSHMDVLMLVLVMARVQAYREAHGREFVY